MSSSRNSLEDICPVTVTKAVDSFTILVHVTGVLKCLCFPPWPTVPSQASIGHIRRCPCSRRYCWRFLLFQVVHKWKWLDYLATSCAPTEKLTGTSLRAYFDQIKIFPPIHRIWICSHIHGELYIIPARRFRPRGGNTPCIPAALTWTGILTLVILNASMLTKRENIYI